MNSDTIEAATQIIKDAGVVELCATCMSNDVYADDEDAERKAYAMATNAWKEGERGFRGMSREDVMRIIKSAIRDADRRCPSCGQDWD